MPMKSTLTTIRNRRADDEAGIAMVTAILVIAFAGLLAVLASTLSFHSQSTTQVDRKRTQAISAAEAGLDTALLQAQSATLPCTTTGTLPTEPTTSSFTVAYTYYDSYPAVGAALTCTPTGLINPVTGLAATAKAVQVTAKGTTNAKGFGDRSMQALAALTAIPGNDFNKAIFANATLSISNNTTINGNIGNDGDIYTNNAFNCSNSLTVKGSVYTQGSASLANTCAIVNDLYAKNNITGSNSASIGRDAKTSQGNISLTNTASIGHDAIAFGTITAGAGAVGNNRVSGANIPAPPFQTFPQLVRNDAAWAAAPYNFTSVIINNSCSGGSSVYNTINSLSAVGANTLIVTSCALSWANNTNITFGRDVAIFSTGGFQTNNNFTMKSNVAGTERKLYWVVPYNAVASVPCTSPGITTSNQSNFTDLQVFFYSPCNISAANKTTTKGQIYSGSNVTIANLFTLTYIPVPVTGVINSTALPLGYTVDVTYKRETKSG